MLDKNVFCHFSIDLFIPYLNMSFFTLIIKNLAEGVFLSFFVSSQFFFHNCVLIVNCLHSCFGRMLFASHLFIGLCTLLLSRYWVHIKCDKLTLLGSSCSKLPWQRDFWKCMMRFLNRHSVILSTVYAFYCTSEGKDYVSAQFSVGIYGNHRCHSCGSRIHQPFINHWPWKKNLLVLLVTWIYWGWKQILLLIWLV